ncbi:DUF5667 domain-containing protein [Trujillonella endophytica]|uniref:DUF5667 domain-containing protein n=1 Tax=Trujillonella endophytica TaxID=673521 RepID=A0A1H8RH06_9ACTN|nr:DUF5667 domain-containing protein [Trujillella endophytica]SEO65731.1 hypothetical protein SAMN05660991_01106 [Trujillella endophytica]
MTTEDGGARVRDRRAGVRDRDEVVVGRLGHLAAALDDEPSPGFRTATRARLVAMAAVRSPEPERPGVDRRLLRGRAADGPPPRWRTRVTAGLAGAALAVSALGTLVALAADAEPGDLLYDLKRGTEQTQLALAGDDRALTLLQFAGTRLEELAAARDDADLVRETLATMDAQTAEGAALLVGSAVDSGSSEPLDRLAGWSDGQAAGLAALRPELPASTADAAQSSLELLDAVQARVAAVEAALGCPGSPAPVGSDDLGPIPGICRAETPSAPPSAGGGPTPAAPTATPSTAPAPPAAPLPSAVPQPGGGTTGPDGSDPGSDPGSGSASGSGSGSGSDGPGALLPSLPALPSRPAAATPPVPSPTPAAPRTPPPLIDLPLPICIPRLIC